MSTTPEQLQRMHAAKQASDERRHADYQARVIAFRAWLKDERRAYMAMAESRALHGALNRETLELHRAWRMIWRARPNPPPDSAEAWAA